MSVLDHVPVPRRLTPRVWLLTLPSALVSFERRQKVPSLPIGPLRFAGVPLIAGGVALAARAWRNPDTSDGLPGPLSSFAAKPATLGGILVLGGVALLLRSTVLAAYSVGVAVAAATDRVTVDEPNPSDLLGA